MSFSLTKQLVADFLLAEERARRFNDTAPFSHELDRYCGWLITSFACKDLEETGLRKVFNLMLVDMKKNHLCAALYTAAMNTPKLIRKYTTAEGTVIDLTLGSVSQELVGRLMDAQFVLHLKKASRIYEGKGSTIGMVWPDK